MHPGHPSQHKTAWIVVMMVAIVAIPAGIALHTVRVAGVLYIASNNPTPYGYSCSLLLFIVPIAVIAGWLLPHEQVVIPKRAFYRTIAILVPIGFGLDFFFASSFFTFPNSGATLGISAPAIGGSVPAEEYVFYLTGFISVLLIYVWLSEYWLSAYNVPNHLDRAKEIDRVLKFHPASLIVAASLIGIAVVYKKYFSSVPEGFTGYFTVLVVGGLAPSIAFFPVARNFINWRAFSVTSFIILLISLLWEATLAVPYGWWGYQKEAMLGLFIDAWAGLPFEAVTVWIAVTYGTVIVYEVVRIWQASGKGARRAFLGGPHADGVRGTRS